MNTRGMYSAAPRRCRNSTISMRGAFLGSRGRSVNVGESLFERCGQLGRLKWNLREEHRMHKISEVMTRDIHVASPDQTIREAAVTMAREDIGSLPVGENDRLVGMITDRDIVLRAVAEGLAPDTRIRDVMTDKIKYCFEDEDIANVAQHMADLHVRRLPVINRDKRLVGIVALSNVAQCGDRKATDQMLRGVATPH